MPIYKAPVEDVNFLLNDVFQIDRYDNLPGFSDASADLREAVLSEAAKLSEEVLQPLNRVGDIEGCIRHDDGSVTTPKGFKQAFKQVDGSYKITGTKIFISSGEHDLSDNIIHLVLARIEGAPAGIKGVSLFVVPKILVNPDGSLGARNGVSCGSIEHKMGIHGNSTCVMNYDGATGWLIGEENKGMQGMFVMMNEARLGVAVQGLAQSEVAYQNAVAYARERLQGRAISGVKAPDKPADAIIVHPAVRRTLRTIRHFNEAARAVGVWAALKSDVAHRSADPKDRQAADDHMGLMTPVLKCMLTDTGFANAVQAQQMYGGHGYIAEQGMEQFVRD